MKVKFKLQRAWSKTLIFSKKWTSSSPGESDVASDSGERTLRSGGHPSPITPSEILADFLATLSPLERSWFLRCPLSNRVTDSLPEPQSAPPTSPCAATRRVKLPTRRTPRRSLIQILRSKKRTRKLLVEALSELQTDP